MAGSYSTLASPVAAVGSGLPFTETAIAVRTEHAVALWCVKGRVPCGCAESYSVGSRGGGSVSTEGGYSKRQAPYLQLDQFVLNTK